MRPAQETDRSALYRICLQTGDSGADGTALYSDPLILGHVYAGPYLTYAPDFAVVLEDESGVCGYVIGAPHSQAFEAKLEQDWWPNLRQQYPDPHAIPPAERTWDQRIAHLIHHPSRTPDDLQREYPSHLHIDLLPRAQGGGNGRKLMNTLLAALKSAGSPGVHLGVGGRNTNAQAFYRHLGFQELQRWPSGGITFGMKFA